MNNVTRGGSRAASTSKIEHFVIIAIITKLSILDVAAALDPSLVTPYRTFWINELPYHDFPLDTTMSFFFDNISSLFHPLDSTSCENISFKKL